MSVSPEPLRVLHLITDLGKGGAERFLLDLCGALEGRGDVEVVIGSLYDDDRWDDISAALRVVPLDYATFSLSRPPPQPRYSELLDHFRPHVVHSHRYLAEFLTAQDVREDVAYVCHGHDNMVQLARPHPGMAFDRERLTNWLEKRWLVREKYRRVRTAYVANSEHTLGYYRRVLPREMRADVRLIPYGFDYDRFRVDGPRSLDPGGPVRLVNVGSFQPKKNQALAVDVVRELADRGVDATLDLLGDGQERPAVELRAREAGVAERVRFHGNVQDVEDVLHRSDVYLHTAWYEPFGLVILEAMAAGLPCVILDGKGDRELIDEGRNGYLLEESDPAAFADRIMSLTSDPEAYTRVSGHARTWAAGFDIEAAADRFVDFYRSWRAEVTAGE